MVEKNFYSEMPSFNNFLDFTNEVHYHMAPKDWVVIITDVAGSTKAIQEGRYKIVNMVGASTIVAIVNALGDRQIPFIFGGDGSTAIIPLKNLDRVKSALLYSQKISMEEFGLTLRIGIVPHQDLIETGSPIRIAKYELVPNNFLAFVKGNGLSVAERLVKDGKYNLTAQPGILDFDPHEGLSCRWSPLPNQRGMMLSILIKLRDENSDPNLLKVILQKIDSIVDLNSYDSHPIKPESLTGEKILKAAEVENKFNRDISWLKRIKIYLSNFITKGFERRLIQSKKFNMNHYKDAIKSNSDFRKYDETLRMVIDCSAEMHIKIEDLLRSHYEKNEIFYGIFSSKNALMTCFVKSTKDDEHVHFIDGGDGGYAMAAQSMKEQIKKAAKN